MNILIKFRDLKDINENVCYLYESFLLITNTTFSSILLMIEKHKEKNNVIFLQKNAFIFIKLASTVIDKNFMYDIMGERIEISDFLQITKKVYDLINLLDYNICHITCEEILLMTKSIYEIFSDEKVIQMVSKNRAKYEALANILSIFYSLITSVKTMDYYSNIENSLRLVDKYMKYKCWNVVEYLGEKIHKFAMRTAQNKSEYDVPLVLNKLLPIINDVLSLIYISKTSEKKEGPDLEVLVLFINQMVEVMDLVTRDTFFWVRNVKDIPTQRKLFESQREIYYVIPQDEIDKIIELHNVIIETLKFLYFEVKITKSYLRFSLEIMELSLQKVKEHDLQQKAMQRLLANEKLHTTVYRKETK